MPHSWQDNCTTADSAVIQGWHVPSKHPKDPIHLSQCDTSHWIPSKIPWQLQLLLNNWHQQQVRGGEPFLIGTSETNLKNWVQCWAPQYKRDMDMLKTVQRRAMKMMKRLKHLSSEQRLRELGLFNLEKRTFPTVKESCSCLIWVSYTDNFRKQKCTFGESSAVSRCYTCVSLPGLPVYCKLLQNFIDYKSIHLVFLSDKGTAKLQQV